MYRHLGRQARRQGIGCFRVYDHDLPDFPFLIELYEDKVYVSEYKRNHMLSEEAHEDWLEASKKIISEVFGLDPSAIYLKLRQRNTACSVQRVVLRRQRRKTHWSTS